MNDIQDQLLERAAKLRERVVHTFKIPAALAAHGIAEVGLVELTMDEELLCTKRARGDAVRLAFEYSKECLRFVDGVLVRSSDGSADKAWARMHPKVRTLVMRGYQMLHQPQGDEDADFLESHAVRVG